MTSPLWPFISLGIALGIGLLIGLERGWEMRTRLEGTRVAGLRTFGIIGLFGGGSGLIALKLGQWFLGLMFVAFAIVVATTYLQRVRSGTDIGATTAFSALLTFSFGIMATIGYPREAAAAAVVTALLLAFKPTLHGWVRKLEKHELQATLKLLLISVVLLPVLPNRSFGPLEVFNPFEVWLMVVAIAGISYLGYFAIKIGGTRYGPLATGVFGGLAASTAATLGLARIARRQAGFENSLTAGILAAGGTMYLRVLAVVGVINPSLLAELVLPYGVMAALTYGAAALAWRQSRKDAPFAALSLENPFQLGMALKFGLLLLAVLVLSHLMELYFGSKSVIGLAAVSGTADVDAITLTLARMAEAGVAPFHAVTGILVASITNTLTKGALAWGIAGYSLGWRCLLGLGLPAVFGAGLYFLA